MTALFDKLVERGKLSPEWKKVNGYCAYCGNLIFKVKEVSHFMDGEHKCGKCERMIKIPQELKFK
ncbi:MAG: hypothetical protein AB1352_05320 [Patescibacteria group bacterium]